MGEASRPSVPTPQPSVPRRVVGLVRVVHPFPSILDGLAVLAIALVAGADPATALRLGVAMTAFQFAIGATNDLVDAPADAIAKPSKPIPAGLVRPAAAAAIVVAGLAIGTLLTVPSGLATLVVAALGTGTGLAYDRWLKATPWAPLAYAVAIPLLPVYAWLGATGTLPSSFLVLVPIAALAGATLALANTLVDVERDAATGHRTLAVVLGRGRAWTLLAVGWALVAAVVVGTAAGAIDRDPGRLGGVAPVAVALLAGGLAVGTVGVALGRSDRPARRGRGWELLGIGTVALGVGWLLAIGG